MKNIQYKTRELVEFFSANRQKWEQFYPSERWVFEKLAGQDKALGDVLDVGCACGGLGAALSEKFILNSYTGVDINEEVIDWACKNQKLSIPLTFIAADVLEHRLEKTYDLVVSLSCADWNIETERIVDYCWDRVKPGGYLVISLRITKKESVNDIKKSYQYINFSGKEGAPEIANYVVFNFKDILSIFKTLSPHPQLIGAYGYWGRPSLTAITPYKKLVFAVFYIRKGYGDSNQEIKCEFSLPIDIIH